MAMEARLKAHSLLFSSMAKLLLPLTVKGDGGEEEEGSETPADNKFSVERVRSISLTALQERLKEKISNANRKRKSEEVASEVPPTKKKKKMEKSKGKKGKGKHKENKNKGTDKSAEINGHSDAKDSEAKPALVDENGQVVFSKFDFSSSAQKEVNPLDKESKKKSKDYKALLAKAEAGQRKLEELKKTDEKRGDELAKKLMWQKAMDMARGTKIKDDPKMLKKTMKSMDKKKKKSSKKWEERKKSETEAMEKRQAKRNANIEERKGLIKSSKLKKRTKKGKGRTPGF